MSFLSVRDEQVLCKGFSVFEKLFEWPHTQ